MCVHERAYETQSPPVDSETREIESRFTRVRILDYSEIGRCQSRERLRATTINIQRDSAYRGRIELRVTLIATKRASNV